ncbi:MAG: hypothetical protein D6714_00805 [Bacteroidetes bacterium]|nr:MAG: hypothetical protein D6714_00805 [Bacteroidota bacterium]
MNLILKHLYFSNETYARTTRPRTPAKRPPRHKDGDIFPHKKHHGITSMELDCSEFRIPLKLELKLKLRLYPAYW